MPMSVAHRETGFLESLEREIKHVIQGSLAGEVPPHDARDYSDPKLDLAASMRSAIRASFQELQQLRGMMQHARVMQGSVWIERCVAAMFVQRQRRRTRATTTTTTRWPWTLRAPPPPPPR